MNGAKERSCKFDRALEKYGIAEFEQEVEEKWRSPDGPGLRRLADQFNKRILRESVEATGQPPLEGEIENWYNLLTDEETSAGVYTQVRNRLQNRGVDVELVEDDFVSYQTINRHFKNCRELSKEQRSPDRDELRERVFALRNRASAVTENTLAQLERRDGTRMAEPDVVVDITVSCERCGAVLPVTEVIDGGSCDCVQ